jgi:hypothetical protein
MNTTCGMIIGVGNETIMLMQGLRLMGRLLRNTLNVGKKMIALLKNDNKFWRRSHSANART